MKTLRNTALYALAAGIALAQGAGDSGGHWQRLLPARRPVQRLHTFSYVSYLSAT
jgi:hypothetical protein